MDAIENKRKLKEIIVVNIIKNLFGKDHASQKPIISNPYEKWPYSEAGDYAHDRWDALNRIAVNGEAASRLIFRPSIIIGLGSTGVYILEKFTEKINDSTYPVIDPRCGLIGIAEEKPTSSDLSPFKSWHYRSLEERHLISGGLSNCFIHVSNHGDDTNVNLFIVGSLSDVEFKYLADLIQIIRLNNKINRNILHIVGLFSVSNLDTGAILNEKDLFARMRELNRFQFNGPHWMETPFNEQSGIINQALIDHVFLVGDKPGISDGKITESNTRAIIDFLSTMVKPESMEIWTRIRDEADPKERGIPLYNTFSSCSLETPVKEIIEYASIRLARTALFNINREANHNSFFEVDVDKRHFFNEEHLAIAWLETKQFSSYHPFFQWIAYFEDRKINDLKNIHLELFEADFRSAFQMQISSNLIDFLNDTDDKDRVYKAKKALIWIDNKVKSIQYAFAPYSKESQHVNFVDFEKTIKSFGEILESLITQLGDWEKIFLPEKAQDPTDAATTTEENRGWSILMDNAANSSDKENATIYESLDDLFQSKVIDIKSIYEISDSSIIVRFPIIGFGNEALKEVEKIYESCLHPGTSSFHGSDYYEKVRARIGWEIELSKFENPKLVFVCVPPDKGKEDLQNLLTVKNMKFSADDAAGLIESLLGITKAILKNSITEELSGNWFLYRLKEKIDYLSRVNDNRLLDFNFESAMRINPKLSVINTITVPQTQVDIDFSGVVYPNSLPKDVSVVKSKQGTSTVAIKFTLDIPVNTIKFYEQISRHAVHDSKFRFPQEKNVVRYEQKIHTRGHTVNISPDLARCFVDIKLVSLFCQAYFLGLLQKTYDKSNQINKWVLTIQSENFYKSQELERYSDGADAKSTKQAEFNGLLNAFYMFTNILPHSSDIHGDGSHLFFEKSKLINYLKDNIAEVEMGQGMAIKQEKFIELQEYFEIIQGLNRLDLNSFYYVLLVEHEYPVWKEII